MSPVSAPADKRFRRAHIKPARRRGKWRGLVRPGVKYGVLLLIALYGAYRGGGAVMHARLLQVDRIVVRGTERLSTGSSLGAQWLRGESIVWSVFPPVDPAASSPWCATQRCADRCIDSQVSVRTSSFRIARIDWRLVPRGRPAVVIDEYGPHTRFRDLRSSPA